MGERISSTVYEYKDYKKFILDRMKLAPNEGRGLRKLLAEALGCQTPFITHVLSGDYHFSLEQAEACARWLGLSESDTEYFLLLVMKQRAGTRGLENVLSRQLSERRQNAANLKKRLNIDESLSAEVQAVYYSSWHFAAVHIALLVPSNRTIEALQNLLQLSRPRVVEVLEFLARNRLIEQSKSGYKVLRPVLHLEKNSTLLNQHMTNWRLKAAECIQNKSPHNLHYSGVASVSSEDFEWVRERVSSLLEELISRIKDSKDEKVAALNLDWFEL